MECSFRLINNLKQRENEFYDPPRLELTIVLPRTKTVTVVVFTHSSMTSVSPRCPKDELTDKPSFPELGGSHILEPWDNSAVGGHGNQLLSNR